MVGLLEGRSASHIDQANKTRREVGMWIKPDYVKTSVDIILYLIEIKEHINLEKLFLIFIFEEMPPINLI